MARRLAMSLPVWRLAACFARRQERPLAAAAREQIADVISTRSVMVWEERWHPLRREWVVISSHRDRRPWQGETVGDGRGTPAPYAPDCYLCPGNVRVSGERNPRYTGVFA